MAFTLELTPGVSLSLSLAQAVELRDTLNWRLTQYDHAARLMEAACPASV